MARRFVHLARISLAFLFSAVVVAGQTEEPRDAFRLPSVLSDHMVLQAGKPAAIWGWATPGADITVEFSGQKKSAKASSGGKWSLKLDPLGPSAESRELRINDRVVHDVLVGEVWLASGQSNMEMQISGKLHGKVDNAEAEIAAATHPEIRLFVHDAPFAIYELPVPDSEPALDRPGRWRVCSPETVADFSAMGYFVARDLLAELKQPVGILTSAVGGTPIEAWTSLSAQRNVPELKPLLDDWSKRLDGFVPETEQKKFLTAKATWLKARSAALKAGQPAPKAPAPFKNLQVMTPGGLFASMIAPLAPYTLRGVLWYQGERNAAGPFTGLYGLQLRTLIAGWRSTWEDELLHFAWVQLPAVKGEQKLPFEPNGWGVAVREGQRRALDVPHTCMAITIDLGGEKAGHPTNKADYAKRLSTVVLSHVYQKDIALPSGPLFKSATVKEGRMILRFRFSDGLKAKSGELEGFAIAGSDGTFVWAKAKIENDHVLLWHDAIPEPKAACYGCSANPKGNLVNGANLPASPFQTGD